VIKPPVKTTVPLYMVNSTKFLLKAKNKAEIRLKNVTSSSIMVSHNYKKYTIDSPSEPST
jgi:hypothetical protein